jgi:hypothetical protein
VNVETYAPHTIDANGTQTHAEDKSAAALAAFEVNTVLAAFDGFDPFDAEPRDRTYSSVDL